MVTTRLQEIKANKKDIKPTENVSVYTPFIEHKLSKTLRRVLKYSFRGASIIAVLLFSSVSVSACAILLHLSYCYFYNTPFRISWFEIWMLIEGLFLLGMNIKYKVFKNLDAKHLPKIESEFPAILYEFSLIEDMEQFLSGWFFGQDAELITEQDFIEWTACTFFNVTVQELFMEQEYMCFQLLKVKKVPFYNSSEAPLNKILLTLDPPVIYHRPMIYYCFIRLVDRICRFILQLLGFIRKTDCAMPFYIRPGLSNDPAIVFFHGLGIGLTSYIPFVFALAIQNPDRNILLFEMPSIQMKLNENHVLPSEYASHVAQVLLSLGLKNNIVAGHSMGTACVRWMDLYYPELVSSRVFIDPIVFALWHHHIAHHALYRQPKTFHELFLKYVAMAEPGHATYLHRYFVWFQNTYLTQDLPRDSYIFLSEKDNIVETRFVVDYLVKNPHPSRQVVLIKAFRHGQILASPEVGRVVAAIQKLSISK